MSNRLSDEKAQLIASTYCLNGFKKVGALLSVGYAKTYANSKTGLKLYDNDKVKLAIKRIQAVQVAKTGYNIEIYQRELEAARSHAEAMRQPAAEVSAIVAKGRSVGLDKDVVIGEKTVIIIGPRVVESPAKQVESEVIDDDEA